MTDKFKVYFIGIGGIGISALARYFLSEGWQVSGSDLSPSDTIKELKKEGVKVYIGHQAGHIRANMPITKVIYNQAIPASNAELQAAKLLGISYQNYPEAVGELTKRYKTIAIAGAHGKSTTTALVSLILIEAGFDPTVIIGTKLKEFGGKNFRKGKSEWLVLEADEWRASFLNYSPAIAIITNIDREHLDFYKNLSNIKKTFEKFKKQCGKVLTPETDPKILAEIKKVLKIPGWHNLYDASCAYSVAKYLGIQKQVILKALGKYIGAWRRMEYRGKFLIPNSQLPITADVYDDYAHHPNEIKATLAGFREKYPKNALICVFQPHQADRLRRLFADFKNAFKEADKTIILPEYKVAGREEIFDKRYNSEALAKAIGAIYIKNPKKDLKKIIKTLIVPIRNADRGSSILQSKIGTKPYTLNFIVVMMGAGDIVNLTKTLIN